MFCGCKSEVEVDAKVTTQRCFLCLSISFWVVPFCLDLLPESGDGHCCNSIAVRGIFFYGIVLTSLGRLYILCPFPFIFSTFNPPPSIVYSLSSTVCCLPSVVCRLSFVVCHLSSAICRLSCIFWRLLSIVCCLPSAIYHRPLFDYPPSSCSITLFRPFPSFSAIHHVRKLRSSQSETSS